MDTFPAGQWHDLVMTNVSTELMVFDHTQQRRVYASNWTPLWAGLAQPESKQALQASRSFAKSGKLCTIILILASHQMALEDVPVS